MRAVLPAGVLALSLLAIAAGPARMRGTDLFPRSGGLGPTRLCRSQAPTGFRPSRRRAAALFWTSRAPCTISPVC